MCAQVKDIDALPLWLMMTRTLRVQDAGVAIALSKLSARSAMDLKVKLLPDMKGFFIDVRGSVSRGDKQRGTKKELSVLLLHFLLPLSLLLLSLLLSLTTQGVT